MFDLIALTEAGFENVTGQEFNLIEGQYVERPGVTVEHRLRRGNVRVITEQNTQQQLNPLGVSTTIQYPEIAIVENTVDGGRVACDSSDVELILRLATELDSPSPTPRGVQPIDPRRLRDQFRVR